MIKVIAFARVRELLGFSEREFGVTDVPTVGALRARLEGDAPELVRLRASTRIARNGRLVDDAATLHEGDEVALLPPVGGG
ncbi:MAG: MoaD/ThiS family protein [Candidatus Eremiobacteraeota bacterium]|nr:MoaD/ThiS family protein [Candidatus Eremiobacteraeota bacterium]